MVTRRGHACNPRHCSREPPPGGDLHSSASSQKAGLEASETAEIDNSESEFRSADEAIGYGRRLAEELFELAEQLALDSTTPRWLFMRGKPIRRS